MKQIAVVSGKGGTGKTTLVGSLEYLFGNEVLVDCDVDASNLHLLFKVETESIFQFYGGKKASIIPELCTGCGDCESVCRFDAISQGENDIYQVDPYACEGCKACLFACSFDAIVLEENLAGHYFRSSINKKPFIHAHLKAGEENSGGLIADVRKVATKSAERHGLEYIIIDGAPGIGCPATSSIIGVNYVIIVSEPTQSGLHDLKRMAQTIKQYDIPMGLVINKWDVNPVMSEEILRYCKSENLDILGKIAFDPLVVKATREGKPVIQYRDSGIAQSIRHIFKELMKRV